MTWNLSKDVLAKMGNPSLGKLCKNKEEWEYYLQCFYRKGTLHGPLNYYKTRELNFKDELDLADNPKIQCPALFIGARLDRALPPWIWEGQGWVPQLERYSVSTGHWCLVENAGREIAPLIQAWVAKISRGSKL